LCFFVFFFFFCVFFLSCVWGPLLYVFYLPHLPETAAPTRLLFLGRPVSAPHQVAPILLAPWSSFEETLLPLYFIERTFPTAILRFFRNWRPPIEPPRLGTFTVQLSFFFPGLLQPMETGAFPPWLSPFFFFSLFLENFQLSPPQH